MNESLLTFSVFKIQLLQIILNLNYYINVNFRKRERENLPSIRFALIIRFFLHALTPFALKIKMRFPLQKGKNTRENEKLKKKRGNVSTAHLQTHLIPMQCVTL